MALTEMERLIEQATRSAHGIALTPASSWEQSIRRAPPMTCLCCGRAEQQGGCVRGFVCGCRYPNVRQCGECTKCEQHCTCATPIWFDDIHAARRYKMDQIRAEIERQ